MQKPSAGECLLAVAMRSTSTLRASVHRIHSPCIATSLTCIMHVSRCRARVETIIHRAEGMASIRALPA